jgi:hypothetical protein
MCALIVTWNAAILATSTICLKSRAFVASPEIKVGGVPNKLLDNTKQQFVELKNVLPPNEHVV